MQKITVIQKENEELKEVSYICENVTKLKETQKYIAVVSKEKVKHPSPIVLEKVLNVLNVDSNKFYTLCEEFKMEV